MRLILRGTFAGRDGMSVGHMHTQLACFCIDRLAYVSWDCGWIACIYSDMVVHQGSVYTSNNQTSTSVCVCRRMIVDRMSR